MTLKMKRFTDGSILAFDMLFCGTECETISAAAFKRGVCG
jgi:hypothetical protein